MNLSHQLLVWFLRTVTSALFRIDDVQLARVPERGPLILVVNHVNIMEIPIIYTRLQPRRVRGMALASRWKNPLLRWGLDTCGAIPLERGGINLEAMRKGLDVLRAGEILLIAPEGTRSGDGRLQAGHPGIVILALKSGAPMLPLVYYGAEHYKENLKRLRRTDFHIAVGELFYLAVGEGEVTRAARQRMTDAILYRMAALLPEDYRGRYADLSRAPEDILLDADKRGIRG
jgi:1-acyl-sn-glycerol-3-phosphate acyltransferase